ncbi:hypothetical protein C2857_005740 [Epichloe festucae Fl1]|uniref:Uncharacterized protein n=1 Tax=Epichloe festucae (strain Fl1) TaxID=877507 RepID=A0A7S9KT01_EPIFF|nr:hypothetical protein C2857_005740 [Epichloe festucae Fl1]
MSMPDEGSPAAPAAASSRAPAVTSKSTGFAPPGRALRRSKPVDDGPPIRRKSHASRSEASLEAVPHGAPRRSSNFSDYNLDEARNLLNPRARAGHETPIPETSSLASLSLAFALLPAIAGVLFKDGHVVVTDIMLLGLSGVFLHWSVTQPWVWYHSAQQLRSQQEADTEIAVEEELEPDGSGPDAAHQPTNLDDVPEETDEAPRTNSKYNSPQGKSSADPTTTPQQQSALRELYMHEVLALFSCFALPLISAYLLHYIRVQLSRPSEGLVSNYNLTIFLLVSELRAFSHTIQLVKSRTLHLQRVVHGNPFALPTQSGAHLEEMSERLERLEARSLADEFVREHGEGVGSAATEEKASLARDVRNAIQPELDALNRAVRRYEKKATLLQHQTDARFSALDSRLDDAIALAAVAAKNSSSKNILVRTVESLITLVLFPFTTVLQLFLLPLRSVLGLLNVRHKSPVPAKHARTSRTGKQQSSQPRYSGDRVPTRVMKR